MRKKTTYSKFFPLAIALVVGCLVYPGTARSGAITLTIELLNSLIVKSAPCDVCQVETGSFTDASTGNYRFEAQDLFFTNSIRDFSLVRYFNSLNHEFDVGFGPAFTHTFSYTLISDQNTFLLLMPEGERIVCAESVSLAVPSMETTVHMEPIKDGNVTIHLGEDFTLGFKEAQQGYLWTKLVNERGATIVRATHDVAGRLKQILLYGEHPLYTFHWGAGSDSTIERITKGAGELEATYSYNNKGLLVSSDSPTSPDETYTYDDNGFLRSREQTPGLKPTFVFLDVHGRLILAESYLGTTMRMELDANRTVMNQDGRKILYEFDSNGLATKTMDLETRDQRFYVYDDKGRLREIADENNVVVSVEYDSNDREIGGRYEDGSTWRAEYINETDYRLYQGFNEYSPEGEVLVGSFLFDSVNNRRTELDADGNLVVITQFNDTGAVLERYSEGATTVNQFDDLGFIQRQEIVTDTRTIISRYEYDAAGRRRKWFDNNILVNYVEFTDFGRPSMIQTSADRQSVYTYASNGLIETMGDKQGFLVTYTYDENGNLIRQNLNGEITEYEGHGSDTFTETRPNGQRITQEFDSRGRLTRTYDQHGDLVVLEYCGDDSDPCGIQGALSSPRKTIVESSDKKVYEDPDGNRYREDWISDEVWRITRPSGATYEEFRSAEYGNLGYRKAGFELQYLYKDDFLASIADNQASLIRYGRGEASDQNAIYLYREGQLVAGYEQEWSDDGWRTTTTRKFDLDNGWRTFRRIRYWEEGDETVRSVTRHMDTNAVIKTVERSVSSDDRTESNPHSRREIRQPTEDSAFHRVFLPTASTFPSPDLSSGYDFNFTYDNYRISAITFPDGESIRYLKDVRERLQTIDSTLMGSIRYVYGNNGLLERVLYPNQVEQRFTYDRNHRTTEISVWKADVRLAGIAYTYDVDGFLIGRTFSGETVQSVDETFAYNGRDFLETAAIEGHSSVSWEFDPHGNVTAKTEGTERTSFTYRPDGAPLTRAGHDISTALIQVDPAENSGTLPQYGGTHWLLGPNGELVGASNASGAWAWAMDPEDHRPLVVYDGLGTPLWSVAHVPRTEQYVPAVFHHPTNAALYLHNDLTGSPFLVTDSDGNVVWWAERAAYGTIRSQGGTLQEELPIGFHQMVAVPGTENGMGQALWCISRWYATDWGRFLERERLIHIESLGVDLALYRYSLYRPLSILDLDGETATPTPPSWSDDLVATYVLALSAPSVIYFESVLKIAQAVVIDATSLPKSQLFDTDKKPIYMYEAPYPAQSTPPFIGGRKPCPTGWNANCRGLQGGSPAYIFVPERGPFRVGFVFCYSWYVDRRDWNWDPNTEPFVTGLRHSEYQLRVAVQESVHAEHRWSFGVRDRSMEFTAFTESVGRGGEIWYLATRTQSPLVEDYRDVYQALRKQIGNFKDSVQFWRAYLCPLLAPLIPAGLGPLQLQHTDVWGEIGCE